MPKFSVGADAPRKRCSMSTCSLACYSDIAASPVIVHHRDERDERQMDQRQTGKQVNAGIIARAGSRAETGDQKQMLGWTSSQWARQTVGLAREGVTDERDTVTREAVREASRCSFWDRRLRGTAYTPCDCHRLRQHSGTGEEFSGGNMWCCWIDRDTETLYPLSTARQVLHWSWWLLSDYQAICGHWDPFKWKEQIKTNRTKPTKYALIFFPLLPWTTCSWKICDSHVFRLQRTWHKSSLPCDFWIFVTHKCDCRMLLKLEYWEEDV